ncbi:MAG: Tetratricopeptide repeat [Pseudomonadota bacterium]
MADGKIERKVVLVCKKNANSSLYFRSLKNAELEVQAAEHFSDVEGLLESFGAKVVVHALEGFERNETSRFHYNMCRSPRGSELQRFMIYRSNNMRAVAFSLDVGMHKALPQERAAHTLGHAVQMMLQALQNRDALQMQGLALSTSGRPNYTDEEMKIVEKVFKAFPSDLMIRTAMARVCFLRGDYDQAIDLARRILQSEPYAVRAMTILGEIEAKLGQHELAMKLIIKANELAGGNPERLATLARLSVDLGQYPEAKKYLLEALRLFPEFTILHSELQKIPFNGLEAKEVLELVAPKVHGEALTQLAVGLARPVILLRQFQFVTEIVNCAVETLPETNQKCGFLYKVAEELLGMGAKNEAVTQLRRCLEIDPQYPGAGDLLIKIKTNLAA